MIFQFFQDENAFPNFIFEITPFEFRRFSKTPPLKQATFHIFDWNKPHRSNTYQYVYIIASSTRAMYKIMAKMKWKWCEFSLILYLLFKLQQCFGLKYNANKLHSIELNEGAEKDHFKITQTQLNAYRMRSSSAAQNGIINSFSLI